MFYAFFLVFLRIFALIIVHKALRTFLGLPVIVALSSALSIGFLGGSESSSLNHLSNQNEITLMLLALRELGIGVLIALPSAIACEVFGGIGRVVDTARGAQFATQVMPGSNSRVSQLETLGIILALFVAFSLGGYRFVLMPLYWSFSVAGIGILDIPTGLGVDTVQAVLVLSNEVIKNSVIFVGPVLVLCFLSDVGNCLVSRSLGRINMLFELMPLKLVIGLVVFAISFEAVSHAVAHFFSGILEVSYRLMI